MHYIKANPANRQRNSEPKGQNTRGDGARLAERFFTVHRVYAYHECDTMHMANNVASELGNPLLGRLS